MTNKFLLTLCFILFGGNFSLLNMYGQSVCTSKSNAPWELWVSNVQFHTLKNTSEKFKDYAALGYSDYTNFSTSVSKGQSYPLSITPNLSWIGNLPNVFCRVWIDFIDKRIKKSQI